MPIAKLLIAGAVFCSAPALLGKNGPEQELDRLKKAGEPVNIKDIRPQAIPDKDNAALICKKIFLLMTTKEKPFTMQGTGEENSSIKQLNEYYCGKVYLNKLSKNKKAEVYSLLDSKETVHIIELAEQASKKTGANWDLKYNDGTEMLIPHLNFYRSLARLLAMKSWQLTNEGKLKSAIELCITGLKLNVHINNEPILISQLVHYVCDRIILKQLDMLIRRHGISNKQIAEITGILRKKYPRKYMKAAMQGERVIHMHTIFNPLMNGTLSSRTEKTLELSFQSYKNLMGKDYKIILGKDYLCYLNLMRQYITLYDKRYWLITDAEKNGKKWEKDIQDHYIYTRMLTPALDLARKKTAEWQTLLNKSIVQMALEKYKNKHGKYPDSLMALDEKLPKDPFTGKDFSYQLLDKSYKLASAGDRKNKIDENKK